MFSRCSLPTKFNERHPKLETSIYSSMDVTKCSRLHIVYIYSYTYTWYYIFSVTAQCVVKFWPRRPRLKLRDHITTGQFRGQNLWKLKAVKERTHRIIWYLFANLGNISNKAGLALKTLKLKVDPNKVYINITI